MYQRLCVCAVVAGLVYFVPKPASAASKEIEELQRDVAQLQDQVRQLQASQDKQLAALQVLVQQAVDNSSKAYTATAVIQSNVQQSLRDMENKVVAPVVGLGTHMDNVSSDLRTVQQAVSDLTNMVSKIQAQLTDLSNAVKVMQAPPPPPPGAAGGTGMAGAGASSDTPTMSATDLYAAAGRDRQSGKLDLAVQEYTEYLKWYGNTDLAPNAQFYIGWIHYSQGDLDNAAREFDMVLEKYPDNNKTADALYYKGMTLVKMGRRTDGSQEFRDLIKRFPKSNSASQACTQLKGMGYNCTVRSSSRSTRRK